MQQMFRVVLILVLAAGFVAPAVSAQPSGQAQSPALALTGVNLRPTVAAYSPAPSRTANVTAPRSRGLGAIRAQLK